LLLLLQGEAPLTSMTSLLTVRIVTVGEGLELLAGKVGMAPKLGSKLRMGPPLVVRMWSCRGRGRMVWGYDNHVSIGCQHAAAPWHC